MFQSPCTQFRVFDLPVTVTLNRPVTSKFNFKVRIKRVSSRFFVCRLARFAAPIGSRVIGLGRLAPRPPQQVGGGEICP